MRVTYSMLLMLALVQAPSYLHAQVGAPPAAACSWRCSRLGAASGTSGPLIRLPSPASSGGSWTVTTKGSGPALGDAVWSIAVPSPLRASDRFAARRGSKSRAATIGAVLGGGIVVAYLFRNDSFEACADEIGRANCRLQYGGAVLAGAGVGALLGAVIGALRDDE